MKVSFQQEIGLSTDQNDATYENRNSFVGLSGGFGDIKVGRQYNIAFSNVIANDPMGFSGLNTYVAALAGNPNRTSNMILYTAPTFVPGLGVQVSKAFGETTTTNASPTKTNDSTAWGLTYTTGGLYVGTTGETVITTATEKTKNSSTTATYDFGVAKVGYGMTKTVLGAVDTKGGMFSVSAPFGPVTVWYSTGDVKASNGTAEIKTNGSQYGLNYTLSKTSYIYIQAGKVDANVSSFTSNLAANGSGYAIGLLKSF